MGKRTAHVQVINGKMTLIRNNEVEIKRPAAPTSSLEFDDWKLIFSVHGQGHSVEVTWRDQVTGVYTGGRDGIISLQTPKSQANRYDGSTFSGMHKDLIKATFIPAQETTAQGVATPQVATATPG